MTTTNGNKENSDSENLPEAQEKTGIQMLDSNLVSGDLEASMKRAEKFLQIQDRMRKLAVNLTSPVDWVNENGKPYLQWSGTSKIAMAFGVSYEDLHYSKTNVKDDKGEYVDFECTGYVTWQGRQVPETGTGSSRDPFFGKRNGEFIPLTEIDLNNIKKKALTNFLNRGLKSMIGLSYTWEEIETITNNRINRKNVQGVTYTQGAKGGDTDSPEHKTAKANLSNMILEMCDGDKAKAGNYLEELTTWEKDGKPMKGKKTARFMSEAQMKVILPKVQDAYKTFKADKEPPLPDVQTSEPTQPLGDAPEAKQNDDDPF